MFHISRIYVRGQGDRGPIRGQVIPKTQEKWYVIPPCFVFITITAVLLRGLFWH